MYYVLPFLIYWCVPKCYCEVDTQESTILFKTFCINTYLGIENEKGETRKIVQNNVLFCGLFKKIWGHAFQLHKTKSRFIIDFRTTNCLLANLISGQNIVCTSGFNVEEVM